MDSLHLPANGITYHLLANGPVDGPLVLLMHGFPELSLSWTAQLDALGQAGFRAVAPDMRGYGGTDKQGPFDLKTLSEDIAALIRALGREKATVVGHDWGGGVAWATAVYQPDVVERLAILNCPHPAALEARLRSNPRQLLRSWYMFFFLIPWLPEWVLQRDGSSAVARSLRGGSPVREVWTRERLKPYQDNFQQPGAASAALGYYRAGLRSTGGFRAASRAHPVSAPTLILWGLADQFLGADLIEDDQLRPWFASGVRPDIERFEGVGHFVQVEAPDRVNAALLRWLPKAA
jgi:pimeloyl-ACP methyl ester carboxylesterase